MCDEHLFTYCPIVLGRHAHFFSAPAKPRKDPVFLAQTRDNIYSAFILPWQRNVELACEDTGHPPRQAQEMCFSNLYDGKTEKAKQQSLILAYKTRAFPALKAMKSKRENQWSDQMMASVISWFSEMSNNMLPVFRKFFFQALLLDLPIHPYLIVALSTGLSLYFALKSRCLCRKDLTFH